MRPGEATSPRPPSGARMDGSDVLLTFSMATVSPVKWRNRLWGKWKLSEYGYLKKHLESLIKSASWARMLRFNSR